MTMMEQIYIQGAPRSAHDINRQARRSERNHGFSEAALWNGGEANGASWTHGPPAGGNAHAIAVEIANAAPAQANGHVAHNNGTILTRTAEQTITSNGLPHEGSADRPRRATGEAELVATKGRQRTPKPWPMSLLCRLGIHRGQWAFVVERNCTQGRECVRCESVHARTKHNGVWAYTIEGSCYRVETCQRCNFTMSSGTYHESMSPIGGMKEKCDRCGEVETISSDGD